MSAVLKRVFGAAVIAAGMVVSSWMLSRMFVRVRQEQAITVKGYTERDVVSDVGKFTCAFTARGTDLKGAYDRLQQSRRIVLAYLRERGFQENELASGTITTAKIMRRNEQGKETNEVEYHDASQNLTLSSTNVFLIRSVATGITDLIQNGVDISANPPAFYLSDMKDLKLTLLADATRDGYRRAVALAENSGGRVGALISANQGVFQITERNSTDISGYGEYNTDTIEKTAKAIVTLEYEIERGADRGPCGVR